MTLLYKINIIPISYIRSLTMTQKEKRILIISGIINIIGFIWSFVAWIHSYINGYDIMDTFQQFLFSTLVFQFAVAVLWIFRKKVENRGVRLLMLLGIIHILSACSLSLVGHIVDFIKSLI